MTEVVQIWRDKVQVKNGMPILWVVHVTDGVVTCVLNKDNPHIHQDQARLFAYKESQRLGIDWISAIDDY